MNYPKVQSSERSPIRVNFSNTLNWCNIWVHVSHVHWTVFDVLTGLFFELTLYLNLISCIYIFFRCIEAFNHLLYLDSDLEVSQEIQVRLGIAHKNVGNFEKAAKHLTSAFDDLRNTPLFSKPEIKFHIAHCFDAAGDLKTAFEEYRSLKEDPTVQKDPKLLANVCRALGEFNFFI